MCKFTTLFVNLGMSHYQVSMHINTYMLRFFSLDMVLLNLILKRRTRTKNNLQRTNTMKVKIYYQIPKKSVIF